MVVVVVVVGRPPDLYICFTSEKRAGVLDSPLNFILYTAICVTFNVNSLWTSLRRDLCADLLTFTPCQVLLYDSSSFLILLWVELCGSGVNMFHSQRGQANRQTSVYFFLRHRQPVSHHQWHPALWSFTGLWSFTVSRIVTVQSGMTNWESVPSGQISDNIVLAS